jgi:hypothetical protein
MIFTQIGKYQLNVNQCGKNFILFGTLAVWTEIDSLYALSGLTAYYIWMW